MPFFTRGIKILKDNSQKAVLESKLRPPRLRQVLDRPRLLKKLESSGAPRLINICAGPGFGKTTLMAQMAREFSGNSVWYQIDGLDRDPAVFLRHLISGFTHAFGYEGTRARSRLDDVSDFATESESILAVMIDELGEHSEIPIMLCFDDFHLFYDDAQAPRLVEYLIQKLPEKSCVVIATRNYPELTLGRLRSQGTLLDLKDDDLQFSRDELSRLTEVWEIQVSPKVLNRVYKSTEGWAAGLVLTENFLRSGKEIPDLFSQRRMQHNVYEYLAEEVLNSQPIEMQSLLIKAALIDPIDPAICSKALGIAGVDEMLAEAEQRNLFTSRLDDADMYRYHPLFRDFLLSQLMLQAGKKGMDDLRVRFAEIFTKAGQERQAIEQYLAAEQFPQAICLIEKIGEEMLNTAEYGTLEKWIDALKEEDLTPALLIQRAKILMSAGKFRQAMRMLTLIQTDLDNEDIGLLLKFKFANATCLNELGNCQKAVKSLKQLLELPLTNEMFQETLNQMAISYFIGFDHQGLKSCINRSKEMQFNDDDSLDCGCSFIMIMQQLRTGNFPKALRMQIEYGDYERFSQSQRNLSTNNMASCLMLMGKYKEARSHAEECVKQAEKQREIMNLPYALDTLGCLLAAEGDCQKGEQLLLRALDVCTQLEQKRGDAISAIKCHLGTLARRQGKPNSALKYHRESLENAVYTNEIYEIAMSKANIMADLIQVSNFCEADKLYREVKILATKHNLRYVHTSVELSIAWAAYLQGDLSKVKKNINSVLRRSRQYQHNHWLVQEGKNTIPLFKIALENNIEIDYVYRILEQIGEHSLPGVETMINHEDPMVRDKLASLLCSIGSGGALTILRRMRHDNNEFVQETVRASLTKLRQDIQNPSEVLTNREIEVSKWLARGLSNNQIAQKLYISDLTVKTHVVKIFRKLGFTNRVDAALYFQQKAEKDTTFHN